MQIHHIIPQMSKYVTKKMQKTAIQKYAVCQKI